LQAGEHWRDLFLIAFDSVEGAVWFALKVQQHVPVLDADQPPYVVDLSVGAKDGFHIVAIWIEDERRIIMRSALAGLSIVGAACFEGCGVKGVHLRLVLGHECGMLANRVRVKTIDPESWILHAIADAVCANIFGQLHQAPQPERA
jgi:hypothetical protein